MEVAQKHFQIPAAGSLRFGNLEEVLGKDATAHPYNAVDTFKPTRRKQSSYHLATTLPDRNKLQC